MRSSRRSSASPSYDSWRQSRDFRDAVYVDFVSWAILWGVLLYMGWQYDFIAMFVAMIALGVHGRANRVQIQIIQEDVQHWLDQIKAAADKED